MHNPEKNRADKDGVIFICPEYSAHLKKRKQDYTFIKSRYEIAEDKKSICLNPLFKLRIEEKFNRNIVLNGTIWIIPYIFSYNGVIKREKMPKEKLYAYLNSIDLNIEEMEKSPIRDLNRPITKELVAKTKKDGSDLLNFLKPTSETQNYSLPKEIEDFLKQKSKQGTPPTQTKKFIIAIDFCYR